MQRRPATGNARRGLVTALAGAVLLLASACTDDAPLTDELSSYTDPGDGCAQVVSAIAYADTLLEPLGQEQYQDWDDAVRSRIAAVDGTVALEVRDMPDDDVLEQARRVARLAERTAAAGTRGADRVRSLREYRREAAQLVLDCGPYVDTTPRPSTG